MDKRIGIIDMGSNSIRMVIYEMKRNGVYRLIDDLSDTVRLGENMADGNMLDPDAMKRAVKLIKLFSKLCDDYNILKENILPVATSAVRNAINKFDFINMIYTETGFRFRILSGPEEALYAYKAVSRTIDINEGVVVDIGGGSTQMVRYKDKKILGEISIPLGAVTATENFLNKDKMTEDQLICLENHIKNYFKKNKWLYSEKCPVLIGLGGTVRAVGKVHRAQNEYPLDFAHNYPVTNDDFINIYNYLKPLDYRSRKKTDGISSKRADIIIGGLTILKVIIETLMVEDIIISGNGIREGVLFEYLDNTGQWGEFAGVLTHSVINYMGLHVLRRDHAYHVCKLAVSMFNQLESLHGLGEESEKLLKVSSLLHDVGVEISYYGHSRHSFYMILNARLNGLTHREIILIAAIATYHGSTKLKTDWIYKYSMILKPGDITIFKSLAVLLKIAECLDRSETRIINDVACSVDEEKVYLRTTGNSKADLELSLAGKNNKIFEKVYNRILIIESNDE